MLQVLGVFHIKRKDRTVTLVVIDLYDLEGGPVHIGDHLRQNGKEWKITGTDSACSRAVPSRLGLCVKPIEHADDPCTGPIEFISQR